MRSVLRDNSFKFFSALLIVSMLWLGVFGVIAMNHGGGMHASCPMDFIGSEEGSQPMGPSFCTNVHLGMVQQLSNAIPGSIDFGLGIAVIISLALLLFTRVRDGSDGVFVLYRVRYRDRFDKDANSFFFQIKKWVASREERDPSCCLA